MQRLHRPVAALLHRHIAGVIRLNRIHFNFRKLNLMSDIQQSRTVFVGRQPTHSIQQHERMNSTSTKPSTSSNSSTSKSTINKSSTIRGYAASDLSDDERAQRGLTYLLSPTWPVVRPVLDQSLSFYDLSTWPSNPMTLMKLSYLEAETHWKKQESSSSFKSINWPNNIQIATCVNNRPSVRNVLLKGIDSNRGFIFFTNYEGQKGRELLSNPHCSIVFYFKGLEQQIRITGRAEKLNEKHSIEYYKQRPIASQIGAKVSRQSRQIENRAELETQFMKEASSIALKVFNKAQSDNRLAALIKSTSIEHDAHELQKAAERDDLTQSQLESLHESSLRILDQFEKTDPALLDLLQSTVELPSYWGGFLIRPDSFEFWNDGKFRLHSRIVYNAKNVDDNKPSLDIEKQEWTKAFLSP